MKEEIGKLGSAPTDPQLDTTINQVKNTAYSKKVQQEVVNQQDTDSVQGESNATNVEESHHTNKDLQKIKSALTHISPDDRDTWIKVGMALHSELDEDGFDMWDEWSKTSDTYDPTNIVATWDSFDSGGGINIGTLYHLAKQNGWDGKGLSSSTAINTPNNSKEREEKKRKQTADKSKIYDACRKVSKTIWEAAPPAPDDHPYLKKKKIKSYGLKIHDGSLVLKVMDTSADIHGVQYIDEKGKKKYLTGTAKKGHFYIIGNAPISTLYLAEGYATAATIHEVTGEPVVVCFDAGNIKSVAEALRKKLPNIKIVICADNDVNNKGNPGLTKAKEAALAIDAMVAVPEFPDGITGTDFNDLAMIEKLSEIKRQIENSVTITPQITAHPSPCNIVSAADFLVMNFPPRGNILHPWLPIQGLCMIYAPRGVGKTHFSLGVAYAVSIGGEFLGWKADKPYSVLFIDGEMPASTLQERITAIAAGSSNKISTNLQVFTPDLQANGMLDLSDPESQQLLEPHLTNVNLIIVDNLSTLCRSGKENEGDSWLPVQEWALRQRSAGKSVLFVHHAGKSGEQRGSSRREDVLDTVISLKRPSDYTPEKGACFEIHFEKARGIYGDDTTVKEATLTTDGNGKQSWEIKPLDQTTAEKVAALINDGVKQKDIPEIIGITKGAVSKAKQKATEKGLITALCSD